MSTTDSSDLPGEVWKPIPEFQGYYEVSSIGRVRSLDRMVRRGRGTGQILLKGRILSLSIEKGRYYILHTRVSKKSYTMYVHIAVARAFVPNPLSKPCVNHKNGIKSDNRAENLEWVTYSENMLHAHSSGLFSKRRRVVKLSETDVKQIQFRISIGHTQKAIAADYKVAQSTISVVGRHKGSRPIK